MTHRSDSQKAQSVLIKGQKELLKRSDQSDRNWKQLFDDRNRSESSINARFVVILFHSVITRQR